MYSTSNNVYSNPRSKYTPSIKIQRASDIPWFSIFSRKKRTHLIVSFVICLLLWGFIKLPGKEPSDYQVAVTVSTLISRNPADDNGADSPAESSTSTRHDFPNIRDFEDSESRKSEFEANALGEKHVNLQDSRPRQPLIDAIRKSSQNMADSKMSYSTPEEDDDVEEEDLKQLAVVASDRDPLQLKSKVGPNSLQQQMLAAAGREEDSGIELLDTYSAGNSPLDSRRRDTFPTYSEFLAQEEKADTLPDIIHKTFEDATSDVVLEGWEDEWFSTAHFNAAKYGTLEEPKIDFVYTWVNGSEKAFTDTIWPYEINSTLNDPDGEWLESHRVNRYRDWDELRFSMRTVERYAGSFRNKIQILVNAVGHEDLAADATPEEPSKIAGKQRPWWLKEDEAINDTVEVLAQEDFFPEAHKDCLPTFNSLTIENEMWNTNSTVDQFFALSDDMLLGKPHVAADIYSPLFGPTMGFKTNAYNTRDAPTDIDARRFGEKPFLIYSSWLLNRRFGERKRRGQVHFGHSLSRSVMREAIQSFPRPALQSTCQRFRGETGFQLYSWYIAFHYTIERHREVLLWSYIMQRMDTNGDGHLDWTERQAVMQDLERGMAKEGMASGRQRMFYKVQQSLEAAGLEPPKANVDILWTSLDGPVAILDIQCDEFNVNECLAPGFSTQMSDKYYQNPIFSTATILDHTARRSPKCGDCLIKLLLNGVKVGLEPLLPRSETQPNARETVIKALRRYQYTIVEPDALFVMVTDAQQLENVVINRLLRDERTVGQVCLNDDVLTEDPIALEELHETMKRLLNGLAPEATEFEIPYS